MTWIAALAVPGTVTGYAEQRERRGGRQEPAEMTFDHMLVSFLPPGDSCDDDEESDAASMKAFRQAGRTHP
jgi:hypothetical protein